MPFELIVIGFVIVAFVAIAARFMPRDASGGRRLPRIVDESVGMFVVRRALGRPTEAASDREAADAEAAAIVAEDEIAYRIGVPGAPEPTVPTRFVVAKAPPQAHKIPPVVPIATRPVAGGRPQARRPAVVPLRRGLAGGVTMLALALVAFAALSLPRGPQEAVLSATGTPGQTDTVAASELAVVPTPSETVFGSETPGATPSPPPSPSTAATQAPALPTPVATPRPTPTPTPRVTPRPTAKPTPKPTPPPPPPPTPPPTPAPTPIPVPEAWIDVDISCGDPPLTVQFDGTASLHAETFDWNFGDGGTSTSATPSHTFEAGQTVVLVVTNASGSDSAQVTIDIPCP